MSRMIILTGPSCVGKGPLIAAVDRFYPQWTRALNRVVLVNSRSPRPGELDGVDYHFRSREAVEALRRKDQYVVMDVRGDLQALDLGTLNTDLEKGDVLFEGNPFVAQVLQHSPELSAIPRTSVFLSPLSREEITELKARPQRVVLNEFVADIMRRKLLRRTSRHHNKLLSQKDIRNIERRAESAYGELQLACEFDLVIPNHDGEDSENWEMFYYPLGDARRTLLAFVEVLEGRTPVHAERWESGLLP